MEPLFSHLTLSDVHCDVIRNIVSIGVSQDLFDDLSTDPADWGLAQQVEDTVKPSTYQSRTPVIHRPFEDAKWFNAIGWPGNSNSKSFVSRRRAADSADARQGDATTTRMIWSWNKNWQASRFSDGSFGVWYGCDTAETSVYETAYHWFNGLLVDAGFDTEKVVGERKLYAVACDAALVDLRPLTTPHPALIHKTDYSTTQSIGARLHREGHPGLVTASARHTTGHNYAILNPEVLSNPRNHSQLTYRLDGQRIVVEKQAGITWMEIDTLVL
jgi:hypothetical protein